MVSGRFRRNIKPGLLWLILSSVVGIGFAFIFIHQLNARVHPILLELALAQTSNQLTAAIDQAVALQAVSYNDLVTLERSQSGDIVALTSNMAQANTLRADLLATGLSALDSLESMEMNIPLGTIFDWDLLSGLGPGVSIKILYTGTASAEFENLFFSAGINQTCHQIVFHFRADIAVLLPGEQYRTTVTTDVCIAETVIVGKVPETYLQVGQ